MPSKSPYLIGIKEIYESNNKIDNLDYLHKSKKEFSPLSGSEPKYNPKKWNDNDNIRSNHNCYAYVLNHVASKRVGKPQPGYFANYPPLDENDYHCKIFYKRMRKDVPSLYLIDFDTPCRKGHYKGFIALDKKTYDTDYHFYRQDSSGYWSHKPGRTNVVNTDASGNLIKNPLKANRKYKYFNYSHPCFFFCVNPNMTRAHSTTKNYKYSSSFFI